MKHFSMALLTSMLALSSCLTTAQNTNYTTMNVEKFAQTISNTDSVQLLDVRTPEEYANGHINNAVLLDVKADSFLIHAERTLPKQRTVAVYCRSGRRSANAAAQLAGAGYKVVNLDGGIMAWQAAKKTVVTKDTAVADSNGYIVYEGMPCPDFSVQLADGRTVRMSDLRGKVVMLQFTASWCGVCRKEMPHIESEIWQRHKNDPNFVLIGIDRDEPLDKVKKFAKSTGITYPLALDPGAKIFSLFSLTESGVTRNVLIDRNGIIIHRTRLYNPTEFAGLADHIDKELAR